MPTDGSTAINMEEFEELKSICSKKKSAKISQIPTNKPKNRFVNILPCEYKFERLPKIFFISFISFI